MNEVSNSHILPENLETLLFTCVHSARGVMDVMDVTHCSVSKLLLRCEDRGVNSSFLPVYLYFTYLFPSFLLSFILPRLVIIFIFKKSNDVT